MASRAERLLDETGWRILDALQANARIAFSELGRQVGLSAPAVAERVRHMEDAGLITGYRVELGLDKLARWALPDEVVLIEAVPKTSVGKFDKKVLRERFKGWQPKD